MAAGSRRVVLTGGAAATPELVAALRAAGFELVDAADAQAGDAPALLPVTPPAPDLASAVLAVADALVVVLDRDGRIVSFNQACERLTGYGAAEVIGRRVWDLFLLEEERAGVEAVFASLKAGQFPSRHENVWLRRDGEPRRIAWSNTALLDPTGDVHLVVGTGADITDRVLAERALQGSETTYRSLFEQANDAILIVEPATNRLIDANQVAVRQLGYQRADLLRLCLQDLHEPEPWRATEAVLRQLEECGSVLADVELRRGDGTSVVCEISSRCTEYEGRRVYQMVVRDISERRRAEEQLRLQSAALASAANAIVITDCEGAVSWVNPAFTRLTGYRAEEVLGQNPRVLRSGEHPPEFYRTMWQTVLAGRVWQGEVVNRRKDGSLYHEEMTITPVKDGAGAIRHFIAIKQDVSERVEADARLQQALAEAREATARLAASVSELERRAREAALLNQMGDLLQTCNTVEESYAVVARFAPQIFPDVSGSLGVLAAAGSVVEVVASWGAGTGCSPVFEAGDCWALRRGHVHVETGGIPQRLCRRLEPGSDAGVLCVPLLAQGESLGTLHLREVGPGDAAFAEARVQVAVSVAERVALTLANLRLRESLREQAIHDPLTGLYNRRFMHQTLERESRRAVRAGTPLSLILLDLDHFKRVNDSHGHQAGDLLLREVAVLLQRSVRGEDVVCRYGGEEFLLVLPGSDLPAAAKRAELLRQRLSDLVVEYGGTSLGPVRASFGVTVLDERTASPEALLRVADDRLYRAKATGRNRVEAGDEPPITIVPGG